MAETTNLKRVFLKQIVLSVKQHKIKIEISSWYKGEANTGHTLRLS